MVPMLTSDPGSILHGARNLQSSMTSTRYRSPEEPKSLVKLPLKLQAESIGTIGDHGKRRERRNMALLRELLFTILPKT